MAKLNSKLYWLLFLVKQGFIHSFNYKLMYTFGSLSIILVVTSITLFSGISEYSSTLVSRLAEIQQAKIDILIDSNHYYLNYTEFIQNTNVVDSNAFHTFRWISECFVYRDTNNETDSIIKYSTELTAIDNQRELEMDFDTDWKYDSIPSQNVILTSDLALSMDVSVNDYISVELYIPNLVQYALNQTQNASLIQKYSQHSGKCVLINLRVFDIVGISGSSKFGEASGKDTGLVVESKYLRDLLIQSLHPLISSTQFSDEFPSLDSISTQILINLKARSIYQSRDFRKVRSFLLDFSSKSISSLNYVQFRTKLPILQAIEALQFISLFLGLLVTLVGIVLSVLAFVVLQSLLSFSVDARTQEAGIYRLLGLHRISLLLMILLQSLILSIPSCILGLILAQALFVPATQFLASVLSTELSPILPPQSFIYGIMLGIIVPLIATIQPIQNALKVSPSNAFNSTKSKSISSGFSVSVHHESPNHQHHLLQWRKLPLELIALSIVAVIYGFVVYYAFPKALLHGDLSLLLIVFLILLLSILFGLTFLVVNTDRMCMLVFYYVLFGWWMKDVVTKLFRLGIIQHRLRNRKTFAMYHLAIALVVYLNVVARLQIDVFDRFTQQQYTTAIHVVDRAPSAGMNRFGCCAEELELVAERNGASSISWVSSSMYKSDVIRGNERYSVVNYGNAFDSEIEFRAVLPDFFSIVFSGFLEVSRALRPEVSSLSILEQLYTVRGSQHAVIHQNHAESLGLNLDEKRGYFGKFVLDRGSDLPRLKLGVGSVVKSVPALQKNRFSGLQTVFVSFPTLLRAASNKFISIEDVPMERFVVQIDLKSISAREYQSILADLLRIKDRIAGSVEVWEYRDIQTSLTDTRTLLETGFLLVSVFAMLISSFSLITSMYANIHEQSKELAVLRAIGISTFVLFQSHFAESFLLLLTGSLFGVLSGWLVATAQSLQQNLFLDLPNQLYFPWLPVIVIALATILTAFISAALTCRFGKNDMLKELRSQ
eukprot:CAMPEP_0182451054 /NCGR_PEP_ID=MMETSP1172-20130603/43509_1 /TAXON_ID=708627 /ORGANISM="Timspurckia oligopyrenoides, Strain CCMP3278" /LENGTH=1001 /DNA_ID=CAMNT_0024648789 /DNA_START=220 /DNA_END=3225 /DNA_ORIENTATION=+